MALLTRCVATAQRRTKQNRASALLWRRDGASVEAISSVHLVSRRPAEGAEVYDRGTPRGAQKKGRAESSQARPEAESYFFFRIGPRRGLRQGLVAVRRVAESDQILI